MMQAYLATETCHTCQVHFESKEMSDSRGTNPPCCVLKLLVERDENRDLFSHVVSFLHLEEIAGLMASSKFLRVVCLEIPAWRNAEVQLNAMNCFDRCSNCEEPWTAAGHTEECTRVYDDNEWLAANDPRYHENYFQKSAYIKFGLVYQFHTLCVRNLMQFFDFGGDSNNLKNTGNFSCPAGTLNPGGCGTDCTSCQDTWVQALNQLFESSPRHFHLLMDIVSIGLACSDLRCESGPSWYRSMFQFPGDEWDPNLGSTFNDAFDDTMDNVLDLATKCNMNFGSNRHIEAWLTAAERNASERHPKGLGRLGTRLLYKICPMWMIKRTFRDILARCNA